MRLWEKETQARVSSHLCPAFLSLHAHQLGYATYRRVKGYYSGEEDALDMRKVRRSGRERESDETGQGLVFAHPPFQPLFLQSLPRDAARAAMVPLGRDVLPSELEFD